MFYHRVNVTLYAKSSWIFSISGSFNFGLSLFKMLVLWKWSGATCYRSFSLHFTHFCYCCCCCAQFFFNSRELSHFCKIKRSKRPFDIYRWHLCVYLLFDFCDIRYLQHTQPHSRTQSHIRKFLSEIIAQTMTAAMNWYAYIFIAIQINHIRRCRAQRMTQNNCSHIRFINEPLASEKIHVKQKHKNYLINVWLKTIAFKLILRMIPHYKSDVLRHE